MSDPGKSVTTSGRYTDEEWRAMFGQDKRPFTPTMKRLIVSYFRFKLSMTMDQALRIADEMEKYVEINKE